MNHVKRTLSIILAGSVMCSLIGCQKTETVEGFTYRWINSNLIESIEEMANYDIKDDYAAATSHEWAAENALVRDYTYGNGPYDLAKKTVDGKKKALMEDLSVQNRNIELVRTAYGLYDPAYRDTLGVEPLKKYLDRIDAIHSLADVSAYMIDNESNPFASSLIDFDYDLDDIEDGKPALEFLKPAFTLGDANHYVIMDKDAVLKKEYTDSTVGYLLERCGYSKSEIRKVTKLGYRFESKLVSLDYTTGDPGSYHKEQLLAVAGSYPIKDLLEHYSVTDCDYFTGAIPYLEKLQTVYTEENVEEMKAYFKMLLCVKSIEYLDSDAVAFSKRAETDDTNPFLEIHEKEFDYQFFRAVEKTNLSAAMDQAYLDAYYDEAVYRDVKDLIDRIKEQYKTEIENSKNLSDSGKKAVSEKLDALQAQIMKPSNTADYTGVELKTAEDGGSYLDALCVLNQHKYEHIAGIVNEVRERGFWDIYFQRTSTTSVNAAYLSMQNCIRIQFGILEDPIYNVDDPIESKLGILGTTLGHEISHAFDSHNIFYDAEGKASGNITAKDLQNWSLMAERITKHLSSFESFKGSGKLSSKNDVTPEMIADIEGTRVCLLLSEDYDSFDCDLFFRAYSEGYQSFVTKYGVTTRLKRDSHPLNYLRVNYVLMQFDEFYETYDVKPGDGMYLAPEYRIVIW